MIIYQVKIHYKWVEKRQPFKIQMSQIEIKRNLISQDEKAEIETELTLHIRHNRVVSPTVFS